MPKKKPDVDWEKFLDYNMEQQHVAEFTKKLSEMTGRTLYELETLSLYNRYLIDRPVNYAFHRAILNYPVEPVDVMRACLIDGQVILKVEDAEHIKVEPFISRAEWDAFTDELIFIEIKYIYEETNHEDYYWIEHYHKDLLDGSATWIVYEPVRGDLPEKEWRVKFSMTLPYFPYVGIRWVFNESFLEPLKSSIIRLEAAYRVIGAENVERMGLSLYIEGVRNVEDIKAAPRKMGRRVHMLPKDAKFHSPSPDAPGMELMVIEIDNLQTAIERASGVVSVEKLATLSGVSRAIAEKPLIILADELRDRFTDGMVEVAKLAIPLGGAPELKISYRPLKHIENRADYIATLDKAKEVDAITDAEFATELRLLLDLSPEKEIIN